MVSRPRPPSVEVVLAGVRRELARTIGGPSEPLALAHIVRAVVDEERARLAAGARAATKDELAGDVCARIDRFLDPRTAVPPRVINATGVILHTNLGRAAWPDAAVAAAIEAARGYGYLELDEETGRRGPRFRAAEDHLVALTGAEDALVVNNNAAALAIAVGLVGRGGAVIVARGELVEIGGGVRIPDIVRRAGGRLVEVGTTNRTRAADFEAELAEERARVVLRVHPANFTMAGFVESAPLDEVAAVAHASDAVVIDDLGSGALLETAAFGLAHEPTPRERLAAGADVVLFSGDKLVGGPQAGLIVGRADLVGRLRRDPLARAARPDKAILAGVAATLALYRAGVAAREIPVWRKIALPVGELHARAVSIRDRVRAAAPDSDVEVAPLESSVGGGSLPGQTLPSWGLSVRTRSAAPAARRLRAAPDRILARVVHGRVVFDLRTVEPMDDELLARRIVEIVAAGR